jgi:hypothetical protein
VIFRILLLTLALLLSGCAGLRSPIQPEGEAEEREVVQLIAYALRVTALTPEQQRREYSAGNQTYARDKDSMSRMRLALLLATPGTGVYDAARAASLLEPLAAAGDTAGVPPGPLRSFARLLYLQLTERASEQRRATQMREQIDAQKETERTLRQQLDALKEVERSILQRGQDSQPRRR